MIINLVLFLLLLLVHYHFMARLQVADGEDGLQMCIRGRRQWVVLHLEGRALG
jgi:hypothetical protein